MAKKKLKKFLKSAAKAALIGGALYGGSKLLKNRKAKSIADMDDAGLGVSHFKDYITKKAKPKIDIMPSDPHKDRWPMNLRGGGIAKRGTGQALRGGGIAKRGMGRAFSKGGKV